MKHKVQESLNRLFSLRNGIKNDYPFSEFKAEEKSSKERGVLKLVNKDRDNIQELIDCQLTEEELDWVILKADFTSKICMFSDVEKKLNSIHDKAKKQKEMWYRND